MVPFATPESGWAVYLISAIGSGVKSWVLIHRSVCIWCVGFSYAFDSRTSLAFFKLFLCFSSYALFWDIVRPVPRPNQTQFFTITLCYSFSFWNLGPTQKSCTPHPPLDVLLIYYRGIFLLNTKLEYNYSWKSRLTMKDRNSNLSVDKGLCYVNPHPHPPVAHG